MFPDLCPFPEPVEGQPVPAVWAAPTDRASGSALLLPEAAVLPAEARRVGSHASCLQGLETSAHVCSECVHVCVCVHTCI